MDGIDEDGEIWEMCRMRWMCKWRYPPYVVV